MLGRTLKMTFWVVYDHLGKLVAANLISLALLVPPGGVAYSALSLLFAGDTEPGVAGAAFVVGATALLIGLGIVLPVTAVGLAEMFKELLETRDGSLKTYFSGIRRHGVRATALGLAVVGLGAAMATSVWFYPTRLVGPYGWLGILLGAVAAWALLFLLLTALLLPPALVHKQAGLRATVRLTALLVFDNTFLIIGLALALTAWTFLSFLLPPLLVLVHGAVIVGASSSAYELLARKYAALAHDAAAARNSGHMTRLSVWAEAPPPVPDEEDDYLNRGIRDALFPWKG